MLGDCDIMAFVSTIDLERARAFYGDRLGLRLDDVNSFACVFDANGTMLRVTLAETVTPASYTVPPRCAPCANAASMPYATTGWTRMQTASGPPPVVIASRGFAIPTATPSR